MDFFTSDRLVLGTLKERTASIDVGDIDNDGDQDLLVANGRHWPGQNRVFLNNWITLNKKKQASGSVSVCP